MNNLNDLEDQPVGNDIEEEEKPTEEEECPTDKAQPTTYTTTAFGWVSKPPACLIKDIGEATLTAAERNYYFALGELLKENEYVWVLEVELTTQTS